MKKFLFVSMLALAACTGNPTSGTIETNDTILVDTVNVDSLLIDTICVD